MAESVIITAIICGTILAAVGMIVAIFAWVDRYSWNTERRIADLEKIRRKADGCTGAHYHENNRIKYCRESCTMCSGDKMKPCYAPHN